MTKDSLTGLSFALQFFWLCLIVIGFVRLVRGRPGGRSTSTTAGSRGFAVAAIVVGLVALPITIRLTDPPWRFLPGRHAGNHDTTAIISDRVFDSRGLPAVHVEAPEGWRIAFDSANRMVLVIQGSAPSDDAPMVFQVTSAVTSDETDPNRTLDMTSKLLESRGLAAGESFVDTLDALRAPGRVLHSATEHVCLWFVKRGPKFTSALVCTDRSSGTDCGACRRVSERVKWRELE